MNYEEAAFLPIEEVVQWWADECGVTYEEARQMIVDAIKDD